MAVTESSFVVLGHSFWTRRAPDVVAVKPLESLSSVTFARDGAHKMAIFTFVGGEEWTWDVARWDDLREGLPERVVSFSM